MGKKVLILQMRPEDAPANNEYETFLRYGDLTEDEVERLRLTRTLEENEKEWRYSNGLNNIKLDNYSCILLGGGPQNISDPEEKKTDHQKELEKDLDKLLDSVVEKDFPFLGACLGIGLLTKHQEGKLSNKYKEEVNVVDIRVTEEGKNDPVLKDTEDSFRALVGHKESCEILGEDSVLLAKGDTCPTQMFRVKQNIYATQFHPEIDQEGIRVRVETYDNMGYFAPGEGPALIARFKDEDFSQANKLIKNFVDRYHKA